MEVSNFNQLIFFEYKKIKKHDVIRLTSNTAVGISSGDTIKYIEVEDIKQ